MTPTSICRESDALAALAVLARRLPGDYLIVGPQASYAYHHWLMPIYKMIDLRIRPDELPAWQSVFTPPWTVLTQIPTAAQIRSAIRLVRLEPMWSDALYQRRHIINGLNFISPEDWGVELLARAITQLSLSECAALLIAQRAGLDWDHLAERAADLGLTTRLREMAEAINREAGHSLLPLEKITRRPTKGSRATRQLKQLTAQLPPALRPSHRLSIAPATVVDVLRGLRASWKVSNGR